MFVNPKGESSYNVSNSMSVLDDELIIGWTINHEHTAGVGILTFALCFYHIDEDTSMFDYRWSTKPATTKILPGLELIRGRFNDLVPDEFDILIQKMTEHENGFNHPDGSVTIEKLGDDIMQIINGKIEYEECSDVDNPPWRTGVFTNDDRSVIVLSVYKKIVISQIGNRVSYDEYCYQLKISSSSIKKRSFSHRSGTEPPTPEWTDLIDTTELSEALEAKTELERLKYYGDKDIIPSDESYFTVNATGETITGLTNTGKTQTELVIPYKIDDVEITSIRDLAFSGCTSLTSINIPNSVTSIRSGAFEKCTSLKSINIPNSVTSISNGAFDDCTSLTSINIPNSVTSIRDFAFVDCTSLTSINIPNSVTSIRDFAFGGCTNLTIYCEQGSIADNYAKENNIPIMYTEISSDTYATKEDVNIKEDKTLIFTLRDTDVNETIGSGSEYRCGEVTSLTLNLPDNTSHNYISSVIFTSGATATNLIYPDTIKMLGEDCIDCIFTPVANKRYEVIVSYDGVNFVGVVGGYGV